MSHKCTKKIMVQTTTGEQYKFILKYNQESPQKEKDLLKNILATRLRELPS